ncbi:MAG: hypothetical protein JXQ72_16155, partial [Anaerolineae bacterium]|nr:hypothetical protein [Anaerolineae bacterium]
MRPIRPRLALARFDLGWIAAVVLPLIGILPTLGHGMIDSADGPYHVHRIYTLSVMLAEGNFWPRWVPYYHLGFGYPIFNFYPPGVSHLGGIFVLTGLTPAAAFAAVAALAWIVGSVGTYALARNFLPGPGALLAALLWAYAPSRLYEVWHQGGLAQMMSAALIPWLLHGMVITAYRASWRGVLISGFALAGIVCTHLPMTYITALYAAPAAILLPAWAARGSDNYRRTFARRLAFTVGGLALGAGLSAIFWLPMALELNYIRAAQENTETVAYLSSRFLQPGDLFIQPRPYDLTNARPDPALTVGLIPGLFGLAGLVALLVRRKFALALGLAAALGFAVFMQLEESLDVWLAIPYFRQLRFPERLLRAGSVWLALSGGSVVLILPKRWRADWALPERSKRAPLRQHLITAFPAMLMIVVVIAALPQVYGPGFFIQMDGLDAQDEIEFEQENHVWGTTSYDEYDPRWGNSIPLPGTITDIEKYADDPLRVAPYWLDVIQNFPDLNAIQLDTATHRIITTGDRAVRFHQYYYPGWTATLDGDPVDVYPEDVMGLITVDVPAGEHTVTLRYTGTTAQRAGTLITLLSLCLAGAVVVVARKETMSLAPHFSGVSPYPPSPLSPQAEKGGARRAKKSPLRLRGGDLGEGPTNRPALLVIAAVIAFALINELIITPHTGWFRVKSPPDDPAYMEIAVHQPFGDRLELLGYTLGNDYTKPDGALTITLYWRPLREITAPLRPRVHLVNLGLSEAWAVSEPFFTHGAVGSTPDRFFSDRHTLEVYDWAPPYMGRIMVQLLDGITGEPLRLPDGSDHLLLDPVIRVKGSGTPATNRLDTDLGGMVTLRCASIQPEGDPNEQWGIDLYWRVTRAPG